MSLILGLDAAQATGYALYDPSPSVPLAAIKAGVLKAVGESYEEKAAALGFALMKLIKANRPDFVAIEMPIRTQPGAIKRHVKFMGEQVEEQASGSGLNAVISSNQMVGACMGIIGAYGLPFEAIAPVTWRTQFLGFGRRTGWQRKDWKRAVRERCQQLKITVTNDDQADAVGIAFAAKACQTWRMIQTKQAA